MPLTYTDSHCHLDWFADPAAVAAEAAAAGVARIVIAATTRAHWADVARCAALPGVYASYGLHPLYQNAHQDDDLHALENQIRTQPSVAIGECGLDFQNGDSAAQRATFAAQIDIARRHRLPLAPSRHLERLRKSRSVQAPAGTMAQADVTGRLQKISGNRKYNQKAV